MSTSSPSTTTALIPLSEDDVDDILYFARTDSLADLQELVASLSASHSASVELILTSARDQETGNTAAHYTAANGLLDASKYIASAGNIKLLCQPNEAGNTPLHYAALNGHVEVVKFLLGSLLDAKQREEYIGLKNKAGKDAVYEAEMAERTEVVGILLSAAVGLSAPEEAEAEAEEGRGAAAAATNGTSNAGGGGSGDDGD